MFGKMVSAPYLVVPLISVRVPLISTRVSAHCQAILLAEPLCKFKPSQPKKCFIGNAIEDFGYNVCALSNTTGQSLWRNNKNIKSEQMVMV